MRGRLKIQALAAVAAASVCLQPVPGPAQPVFHGTAAAPSAVQPPREFPGGGRHQSCLVRGRPVHDFKLKDIISGRMTTFIEAARRDYTFLLFLHASSRDDLESLSLLEHLRDRHRERVGLVTVFLDPVAETDLLRFLVAHQVYPDFALHDPAFNQVRCYGFEKTPALHVIGPGGEIVFTVSSSRPMDLASFTARLDHVLAMERRRETAFAEARKLYLDAMDWLDQERRGMALVYLERVLEIQPNLYTVNCQVADIYRDLKMRTEAARYYARYLRADKYAYDLPEVRASVRSLFGDGAPP